MKNTQKGFIVPLLIAVVVILGVGGWFSYKYLITPKYTCWPYCQNMTDQDRENIKKSVQETNSTSTTSWKTYTNSQYGFQISFPKDLPAQFCLSTFTKNNIGGVTTGWSCVAINKIIPLYDEVPHLTISFVVNPQNGPSNLLTGETLLTKTEKYSVGGINGSISTAGLYLSSHPNDTSFAHMMFQSNQITDGNGIHSLNIELTKFKKSDIASQGDLFKQILSGLKITQI